MRKTTGSRMFSAIAVLALFVAAGSVTARAETGLCVTAEAPSEVILPDGSVHPAGRIEICMTQRYSPVSGLHTARLADGFSGMFLSHRGLSEGVVENGTPYIQFLRASGGELILDAYAVPDGEQRMWLYRIKPAGKNKAKRGVNPELQLAMNENDKRQVVLLAAAAH